MISFFIGAANVNSNLGEMLGHFGAAPLAVIVIYCNTTVTALHRESENNIFYLKKKKANKISLEFFEP